MLADMNDAPNPKNAYPAFWAPFKIVAEGAAHNFLLFSSPLTTAIGTRRHFAAVRKFGPFWIEADIAAGF